ncbi:AT-rich interactive domain-containing protein, putative [Plasmodium knowlesi strain H]|uniref:AT-rich interactive domain-containing protein, putative n=2 Tax=Plasmodium knowlesi TaxID=5850 RepID=B3L827_PLAKH|nr:AT-rich interactive domain-containing protein, putative [Plasmodium knowlesi strain H]OTN64581.1 Uncharacterized protein PKNOH_S130213800 [Plasmodium knowlesi]CAA9989298.1 AT-rich interactive domain-containing protein, putative [Plasmodium knowlesi strain H]VVS78772.1 AT-rich interactive domain-containing protein, putative [Plasmodium knowlesi strain H]|eukprot:XP_002261645.1 hypothetical protein, conserved in Plasmodium species [Plasmodium knowlesi strain H]
MERDEFYKKYQEYYENDINLIPPLIEGMGIELYDLYLSVLNHGGYSCVSRNSKWIKIAREFGLINKEKNIKLIEDTKCIKEYYLTYLREFERIHDNIKKGKVSPKKGRIGKSSSSLDLRYNKKISISKANNKKVKSETHLHNLRRSGQVGGVNIPGGVVQSGIINNVDPLMGSVKDASKNFHTYGSNGSVNSTYVDMYNVSSSPTKVWKDNFYKKGNAYCLEDYLDGSANWYGGANILAQMSMSTSRPEKSKSNQKKGLTKKRSLKVEGDFIDGDMRPMRLEDINLANYGAYVNYANGYFYNNQFLSLSDIGTGGGAFTKSENIGHCFFNYGGVGFVGTPHTLDNSFETYNYMSAPTRGGLVWSGMGGYMGSAFNGGISQGMNYSVNYGRNYGVNYGYNYGGEYYQGYYPPYEGNIKWNPFVGNANDKFMMGVGGPTNLSSLEGYPSSLSYGLQRNDTNMDTRNCIDIYRILLGINRRKEKVADFVFCLNVLYTLSVANDMSLSKRQVKIIICMLLEVLDEMLHIFYSKLCMKERALEIMMKSFSDYLSDKNEYISGKGHIPLGGDDYHGFMATRDGNKYLVGCTVCSSPGGDHLNYKGKNNLQEFPQGGGKPELESNTLMGTKLSEQVNVRDIASLYLSYSGYCNDKRRKIRHAERCTEEVKSGSGVNNAAETNDAMEEDNLTDVENSSGEEFPGEGTSTPDERSDWEERTPRSSNPPSSVNSSDIENIMMGGTSIKDGNKSAESLYKDKEESKKFIIKKSNQEFVFLILYIMNNIFQTRKYNFYFCNKGDDCVRKDSLGEERDSVERRIGGETTQMGGGIFDKIDNGTIKEKLKRGKVVGGYSTCDDIPEESKMNELCKESQCSDKINVGDNDMVEGSGKDDGGGDCSTGGDHLLSSRTVEKEFWSDDSFDSSSDCSMCSYKKRVVKKENAPSRGITRGYAKIMDDKKKMMENGGSVIGESGGALSVKVQGGEEESSTKMCEKGNGNWQNGESNICDKRDSSRLRGGCDSSLPPSGDLFSPCEEGSSLKTINFSMSKSEVPFLADDRQVHLGNGSKTDVNQQVSENVDMEKRDDVSCIREKLHPEGGNLCDSNLPTSSSKEMTNGSSDVQCHLSMPNNGAVCGNDSFAIDMKVKEEEGTTNGIVGDVKDDPSVHKDKSGATPIGGSDMGMQVHPLEGATTSTIHHLSDNQSGENYEKVRNDKCDDTALSHVVNKNADEASSPGHMSKSNYGGYPDSTVVENMTQSLNEPLLVGSTYNMTGHVNPLGGGEVDGEQFEGTYNGQGCGIALEGSSYSENFRANYDGGVPKLNKGVIKGLYTQSGDDGRNGFPNGETEGRRKDEVTTTSGSIRKDNNLVGNVECKNRNGKINEERICKKCGSTRVETWRQDEPNNEPSDKQEIKKIFKNMKKELYEEMKKIFKENKIKQNKLLHYFDISKFLSIFELIFLKNFENIIFHEKAIQNIYLNMFICVDILNNELGRSISLKYIFFPSQFLQHANKFKNIAHFDRKNKLFIESEVQGDESREFPYSGDTPNGEKNERENFCEDKINSLPILLKKDENGQDFLENGSEKKTSTEKIEREEEAPPVVGEATVQLSGMEYRKKIKKLFLKIFRRNNKKYNIYKKIDYEFLMRKYKYNGPLNCEEKEKFKKYIILDLHEITKKILLKVYKRVNTHLNIAILSLNILTHILYVIPKRMLNISFIFWILNETINVKCAYTYLSVPLCILNYNGFLFLETMMKLIIRMIENEVMPLHSYMLSFLRLCSFPLYIYLYFDIPVSHTLIITALSALYLLVTYDPDFLATGFVSAKTGGVRSSRGIIIGKCDDQANGEKTTSVDHVYKKRRLSDVPTSGENSGENGGENGGENDGTVKSEAKCHGKCQVKEEIKKEGTWEEPIESEHDELTEERKEVLEKIFIKTMLLFLKKSIYFKSIFNCANINEKEEMLVDSRKVQVVLKNWRMHSEEMEKEKEESYFSNIENKVFYLHDNLLLYALENLPISSHAKDMKMCENIKNQFINQYCTTVSFSYDFVMPSETTEIQRLSIYAHSIVPIFLFLSSHRSLWQCLSPHIPLLTQMAFIRTDISRSLWVILKEYYFRSFMREKRSGKKCDSCFDSRLVKIERVKRNVAE